MSPRRRSAPPRRGRRRTERGSITPFVVIVSLGIILLAGLVVDGGRQLNGKGRAIAYAQEAARAGAQAVDVTDPALDLDSALALRAARDYCETARAADSQLTRCAANLETMNDATGSYLVVSVTAQVEMDAILLGMIGRTSLTSTGTALARPISGIAEANSGQLSTLGPPSVAPPGDGPPPTAGPAPDPIETVEPCIPRAEAEEDEDEEDDEEDPPEEEPGDPDEEELEVCPDPPPGDE